MVQVPFSVIIVYESRHLASYYLQFFFVQFFRNEPFLRSSTNPGRKMVISGGSALKNEKEN